MRKSFSFKHPKHKPARVVEHIKYQLRKYIKRERRKALPEGMDFWAFDCQVGREGPERELAERELNKAIDEAAEAGWESVYVEVIAKAVKRRGKKPAAGAETAAAAESNEDT